MSSSLNIQISVNIFHAHSHTGSSHKECNFRELHSLSTELSWHDVSSFPSTCYPPIFHFPCRVPWATIRSISCNQVILIHYPYATNTCETCTHNKHRTHTPGPHSYALTTLHMPWHAVLLRLEHPGNPLNPAIVPQVHVHFALRHLTFTYTNV